MKLSDFQNLSGKPTGIWPTPIKALLIVGVCVAVLGAGYYFDTQDMLAKLDKVEAQEGTLKTTFDTKQRKAANYDAYKAQLAQIEESFGTMLRQLPGETEIPSLIVDISQTGLAAGLQEKLFEPQSEIPRDFYAEKPIKIRLSGSYHEIANFVSGVAALPRIVTLHNINITPESSESYDQLSLEVTAQTYRYLDEEAG